MTFGEALKAQRARLGLTQVQAAAWLHHLPVDTLASWEQNARVPPRWLQKLVLDKLWRFNNARDDIRAKILAITGYP